MKKIIYLIPILFFACQKQEIEQISAPLVVAPEVSGLFNLSNVPEITLEFPLNSWNTLLTSYDLNPQTEKKVVTHFSFVLNGKTVKLDSIAVKLRGNTSRRRPEGIKGELHKTQNTKWNHCHFGLDFSNYRSSQVFEGKNKLILKWFKDDAAYAREIYCYDLFRRFGIWTAPNASYCKLTIKVQGDTKPAYYGVYALIESIDEDFIVKNKDKWGENIGFLWKGGWAGNSNANLVSTASMGVEDVKSTPELSKYYAYDLKTRKKELETAKAELSQFINDLNTKTGTDFENWISQKMDVDFFLKTYAVNVMVGMWDDYWGNANNYYFYFAANGKAYFIPYDYDNTLGTSQIIANAGTQNPLIWGKMTQRPLLTKILEIPKYQTIYKNYIKELVKPDNDFFATAKSIQRILAWQSKISPFVSNDTGEDMIIMDRPAFWGNQPNYRLLSGNSEGGKSGEANYFSSRAASITW